MIHIAQNNIVTKTTRSFPHKVAPNIKNILCKIIILFSPANYWYSFADVENESINTWQ